MLAEEFDRRSAVVINEENILVRLWRIASQSNVVRLPRNDDPGHARHFHNLPLASRKGNKQVTVPLCPPEPMMPNITANDCLWAFDRDGDADVDLDDLSGLLGSFAGE